MRWLLTLTLAFVMGCGCEVETTSSTPRHTAAEQEYVIGGRIDNLTVYWPWDNSNPDGHWFTHVGFVHDDGVMQELNLCDNQSMLHPGVRVALRIKGVPGEEKGCYKVLEMRSLN